MKITKQARREAKELFRSCVVGGLLDPQRMERVAVIAHESQGALAPGDVVAALLGAAFPSGGTGNERCRRRLRSA